MTDTALPAEYQVELDRLARRRAMAEAMSKQALGGLSAPTQMVSGHAVRRSPLEGLTAALTMYLGNKNADAAANEASTVRTRAQGDMQRELAQALANPDQRQQYQSLLTSKWPQLQTMGTARQKAVDERLNAGAKVLGDNGAPLDALKILQSGELPQNPQLSPIPAPQFGTDPAGNPYAMTTNRRGEQKVDYAPKAPSQTVSIAGEDKEGVKFFAEDLAKRKESALASRDVLSANQAAFDAIQRGARSGGLEGFKQAIRNVASGFGIKDADKAPTEELSMALGHNILANARKLAPVTKEDISRLEQFLGSINTDPEALGRMLSLTNAIALRDLQSYQQYIGHQSKALTSPKARDLFQGAGIGLELPPTVPGDVQAGLRSMQELGKRGGDVTAFEVPGGVNQKTGKYEAGGAIEPGARFDIQSTGLGGVAGAKGTAVNPMTLDEYLKTPAGQGWLRKQQGGAR